MSPTSPPSQPPLEPISSDSRLRSLEHPLPAGMRDHLPQATFREQSVARNLLRTFDLHGYQPVQAPVFEYADVLERGLGALGPQEVLRFVEPETGEVVALRPDVTPQLARIVATRLHQLPGPARLSYYGSVLRRPQARGRRHRQIPQAGIELIGADAAQGDQEVLEVIGAAVAQAGLAHFVLDLGHAGIATQLLSGVEGSSRAGIVEALHLKDVSEVRRRAESADLPRAVREALVALPRLHGGDEVWADAEGLLRGTSAEQPCRDLRRLAEAVQAHGVIPEVLVDLGETRALEYYTGMTFQILAEGPGRAVAAGGRYDTLLGRFGAPRPAAGAAVDLDHLGWALAQAGAVPSAPARVLVKAPVERQGELMSRLREGGLPAVPAPLGVDALEHGRAWGFSHILEVAPSGARLQSVEQGSSLTLNTHSDRDLAAETTRQLAPPGAPPTPTDRS